MHARLALSSLWLAPLLVASVAHAQAPGEMAPQPAPAAQCPCGPAPSAAEPIMANRWAIGLSVGSMSLAPSTNTPVDNTAFTVGELALRFRATPHFELEASVGGGRQRLDSGDDGDLAVTTAALTARFRFNPEDDWNLYAMAGLGVATVLPHDASQQQRDDATQGLAMAGVGLERRFAHLALQVEARAVKLADQAADKPVVVEAPAMVVTPTTAPAKRDGGSLSIGLSYYF